MTDPKRTARGLWWDRALSLVEGCTPVSPGCAHCWSASQAHIRSYQANPKIADRYSGVTTDRHFDGRIKLLTKNLSVPLTVKRPTTFAVWNDLFHEDVPDDFIAAAFGVFAACPHHTFMVLTKREKRLPAWFQSMQDGPHQRWDWCGIGCPEQVHSALFEAEQHGVDKHRLASSFEIRSLRVWPLQNVWLGVTAEDQQRADERIPMLLEVPAAKRFVSAEPLLGPLDMLTPAFTGAESFSAMGGLGLLIVGSETGPGKRHMSLDWARRLRDQAATARVPFFFKKDSQGRHELDGEAWEQMPEVKQCPEK